MRPREGLPVMEAAKVEIELDCRPRLWLRAILEN